MKIQPRLSLVAHLHGGSVVEQRRREFSEQSPSKQPRSLLLRAKGSVWALGDKGARYAGQQQSDSALCRMHGRCRFSARRTLAARVRDRRPFPQPHPPFAVLVQLTDSDLPFSCLRSAERARHQPLSERAAEAGRRQAEQMLPLGSDFLGAGPHYGSRMSAGLPRRILDRKRRLADLIGAGRGI